MSEQKLKLKVLGYLKKEYPASWVYKTADMFQSGIPDILLLNKGTLYGIELKHGRNKATKLQLHVLSCIKKAGGKVAVCYSLEEVKCLLGENK